MAKGSAVQRPDRRTAAVSALQRGFVPACFHDAHTSLWVFHMLNKGWILRRSPSPVLNDPQPPHRHQPVGLRHSPYGGERRRS